MKAKKHKSWNIKAQMRDEGFVHVIRLPWLGQSNTTWNEACASVMEVFGLPGDKYMSHATMDTMDFGFKSERDAVLCKILLSEHVNL